MAEEQLLLDAIRADPDQPENYLVYGDWLTERGDPRGELIGFQHALAQAPGDRKLAARVKTLVNAQLATLPREVDATWKLGFISEIRFSAEDTRGLRALLGHPLLALLESVSAVDREGIVTPGSATAHKRLLDTLVLDAPRDTLRRLEIGGAAFPLFETAGDLQRVLERFPRLTELAIHARKLPDGCLEVLAPIARSLELRLLNFTDKQLREIATRSWPHLRRLVLHVPHRERDAKKPSPLAPLMSGRTVPALVDLRVREIPHAGGLTERFCMEIVKAPLLARLEALDFTILKLDLDVVRPSYPQLRHMRLLPSAEEETSIPALHRLAYLLEEPETERAVRISRAALALATAPIDRHNINRRIGTCLNLLSQVEEALAAFEASLADDPRCGISWMHKAWALKRLGRMDEASEALARASSSTDHPATRYRLDYLRASLAIARGDSYPDDELEGTRALYATELETNVVDADMFYEHACVLALQGTPDAALSSLASCFELCPPYKVWARSEVDFVTMRDSVAFRTLVG